MRITICAYAQKLFTKKLFVKKIEIPFIPYAGTLLHLSASDMMVPMTVEWLKYVENVETVCGCKISAAHEKYFVSDSEWRK